MRFPLFNTTPGRLARVIDAQAQAHPEMTRVRISFYDYERAGYRGWATDIPIRPKLGFVQFPEDPFPPAIRRVRVEPYEEVEPGWGESP
jgi:hypothetical protein